VKRNRSFKILAFLAESQREASQAAHMKSGCSVQPLDVAGRNQVRIGPTGNDLLFGRYKFRLAVPALAFGGLVPVGLDDLAVIGIPAKGPLNGFFVCRKAVR
jgi:hypothetical protein